MTNLSRKLISLFILLSIFIINCSRKSNDDEIKSIDEPENLDDSPENKINISDTIHNFLISKFKTAGVEGGIPNDAVVVDSICADSVLQESIDKTSNKGGGVIILKSGVYRVSSTIHMKSNVILRGVDNRTVKIESVIRSKWNEGKNCTFNFNNTSFAGLENITIQYKVDGIEPVDRSDWTDGGWCGECFSNDPSGRDDLYVIQVAIKSTSKNCWVKNCRILESGTDPILLAGDYNTFQNNFVDRCYNKGGGGNGYYDVRGEFNLIINDTVKRVRHFAIQQNARFNVVTGCMIVGDVNFHNKDSGYNLIENNTIKLPTWHGWDIFGTGGAKYGHKPPGENNIIVNNETSYKNRETRYSKLNVIYTFQGFGAPKETNWLMPKSGRFYELN